MYCWRSVNVVSGHESSWIENVDYVCLVAEKM